MIDSALQEAFTTAIAASPSLVVLDDVDAVVSGGEEVSSLIVLFIVHM